MLAIFIDTIPHAEQRYPTVGDYFYPVTQSDHTPPYMEVKISELGNEDFEFCVAIHELIEAHLCRRRGISEDSITRFDRAYEAARQLGDYSEPGDSPEAPYQREHRFATTIERLLADELGLDWLEYESTINRL